MPGCTRKARLASIAGHADADAGHADADADADADASNCADGFLNTQKDSFSAVLVGANSWPSEEGVCVLPEWVMHMLGVVDGDEVQVEPLQPLCLLALLVQKNKNWHLTSTKVQILTPVR